jgi:hypothetical protein
MIGDPSTLCGKEDIDKPQRCIVRCSLPQYFDSRSGAIRVIFEYEIARIVPQAVRLIILKRIGRDRCDTHLSPVWKASRKQEVIHAPLRS